MRRKLAAAVFTAGLLALAGCGSDSEGDGDTDNGAADNGGGTEAVCEDINQAVDSLQGDLNTAMSEVGAAAAQDDQEAVEEALGPLQEVIGAATESIRDGAAAADDPDLRQALEDYADALEDTVAEIALGEQPDTTALEDAMERVGEHCGEEEPAE